MTGTTLLRALAAALALSAPPARASSAPPVGPSGAERAPPVEEDFARAFAAARAEGALVLVDVWAPW